MKGHEVDVDSAGNQLTYKDPNGFSAEELHVVKGDSVQWCTVRDALTVKFDDRPGSPFDVPPSPRKNDHPGAKSCTVPATVTQKPGYYPYQAQLTLPGATQAGDPQVIIDGGKDYWGWLALGAALTIGIISYLVRRFLKRRKQLD